MSRSTRKTPTRQDVESVIQKVVQGQENFYAGWLERWKSNLAMVQMSDRTGEAAFQQSGAQPARI